MISAVPKNVGKRTGSAQNFLVIKLMKIIVFTFQIQPATIGSLNRASAFKNYQKVDALADQVYLFAKVGTPISSKHAKNHLFDFSCLAGAQNAPTQENHFRTAFWDPLPALITQRSFRFSKRSKIQIPLMVPFKRAPKKSRPFQIWILTRPDRSLMGGRSFLLLPVIRVKLTGYRSISISR